MHASNSNIQDILLSIICLFRAAGKWRSRLGKRSVGLLRCPRPSIGTQSGPLGDFIPNGRKCPSCYDWLAPFDCLDTWYVYDGSRTFLSPDISQFVKFAGSDNSQFVDFQGRTFLSSLICRVGQFSVRTFVSWLICRAGRQSDIWRIYCYNTVIKYCKTLIKHQIIFFDANHK